MAHEDFRPYGDSVEHLHDELLRLDLLLRRALVIDRQPGELSTGGDLTGAGVPDDLRGLVISEDEIDRLYEAPSLFTEHWRRAESCRPALEPLDLELETWRQHVDGRRLASREDGVFLALPTLAERFALSPAEVDLLLVAVAPEFEPRYETVYAYLQNDVTRKRPGVDLALNLICRSPREKIAARRLLADEGTLVRQRLIRVEGDGQDGEAPFLRRAIRTDDAVTRFLLEQPPAFEDEAGEEVLEVPAAGGEERLERLALLVERAAGGAVRLIGDPEAAGDLARRLAARLGRRCIALEFETLEDDFALWLRNVRLWHGLLAFSSAGVPSDPAKAAEFRRREARLWRALRSTAELSSTPVLLLGPDDAFSPPPAGARLAHFELEPPNFEARRAAWRARLEGRVDGAGIDRLADRLHLSGDRIAQAIEMARGIALLRDPSSSEPSADDLLDAGRVLSRPNVRRFALRIEPRYGWDDIVLPATRLEQLRGLADRMKYRRRVQGEWGFGEKLARGKGLTVLFTGPSGTGKTMAAEILASDLGLDLYHIDLASVVSKYIGETEKHLSAIFEEAEHSPSLLFFDEADALFGKRTEVKDAHDRYANIEVNYLLQRIEQFEGVVVLATNMQRNLDDAFRRRMQEVVEFPLPDDDLRERIWRGHLPDRAPREDDIDFAFLGKRFKLSGGNIRNVVLHAAYLAARDDRPIAMRHLILATQAEYRKQGKLCVKGDFGPYYRVLEEAVLEEARA